MNIKKSYILVGVILILLIFIGYLSLNVPIDKQNNRVIIYGNSSGYPSKLLEFNSPTLFKIHCSLKNGVYNSCGSPCLPSENDSEPVGCILSCAYTCNLK